MNVLQRKMFANGDVANKSFSPALIGYYVSQGYNPAEIKAALPEAPYGLIEEIARIQGGVVNPGVPGPNSPVPNLRLGQDPSILETIATASPTGSLQPGQMDPPDMPNFPGFPFTVARRPFLVHPGAIFEGNYMGVDRPELPTNVDPSLSNDIVNTKIQNLIEEKNRILAELGFPSGDVPELQALDREIESLRSQLPSNTVDSSIEEELANLQAVEKMGEPSELPSESEIESVQVSPGGTVSGKTLTIRDKSTNSEYQLPPNFVEMVENRTLDGMTLYPIINNKNFEFSPDVEAALENFVKTDEPFRASERVSGGQSFQERRGTFTSPEDFGSAAQDVLRGAGNLLEYPLRGIAGFLGELKGGSKGKQEFLDFVPDLSISREELGLTRLLQIPGAKYVPPAVAGDLQEDIDSVSSQTKKEKDVVEDKDKIVGTLDGEEITKADYETLTTDEILRVENLPTTTEDADPDKINFFDPNVMDKLDADIPDVSDIGQAEREEQERVQMNEGSFFSDPKFVNFIRNLGLGLSGADDVASGLVAGTALGSQERDLREQEALKADREAELERIKAGAEGTLKPSDLVSLNKMTTEMSTNIKDFEGSRASIGIMNDAIALFEEAVENNVAVTGLQGSISRFGDQAKALFNIDGEVSDATKIQNYIDQVKQRSIREILNESGRTISNLDREIVDKVFGELNLTDNPQETLKKLRRARRSLMDSNADKQRAIRTNYGIISDNAYGATGIRTIAPYQAMVNQILNANPSDFSTMDPIQGAVITVDYRGKNVFGGG